MHREAGIELWKNSLIDEAKTELRLSKDYKLIELIDACNTGDRQGISGDIVEFLPEVQDNDTAIKLILDTMKNELKTINEKQTFIDKKFKEI